MKSRHTRLALTSVWQESQWHNDRSDLIHNRMETTTLRSPALVAIVFNERQTTQEQPCNLDVQMLGLLDCDSASRIHMRRSLSAFHSLSQPGIEKGHAGLQSNPAHPHRSDAIISTRPHRTHQRSFPRVPHPVQALKEQPASR